jgi:ankyrin repeat protein
LLLERGADVNARDKYGWTPLHFAADEDSTDTVRLLLGKGADANAKSTREKTVTAAPEILIYNLGVTPLSLAANHENRAVLELLLGHGADLEAPGSYGGSIREHAEHNSTLADVIRKFGGKRCLVSGRAQSR